MATSIEDRNVIILAAHCEECGDEMAGRLDRGVFRTFPVRVPIKTIESVQCPCGGQAVFDILGAFSDDPDWGDPDPESER